MLENVSIMARVLWALCLLFPVGCRGPLPPSDPPVRFGVLADIQYADKERRGSRRYREATGKLAACVAAWNERDLAFTVQLGDIVDGRARVEQSLTDLDAVLAELRVLRHPLHHVVGNHCLSVPRTTLMARLDIERSYYDFAVGRWRFVVLDGMDVNVIDAGAGPEQRRRVQEFLDDHPRARGRLKTVYNGGIGREQVQWLASVLARADRDGERVALFCHLPVLAAAAHEGLLIWNHEQIVALLSEHRSAKVFLCGHHHAGGLCRARGRALRHVARDLRCTVRQQRVRGCHGPRRPTRHRRRRDRAEPRAQPAALIVRSSRSP